MSERNLGEESESKKESKKWEILSAASQSIQQGSKESSTQITVTSTPIAELIHSLIRAVFLTSLDTTTESTPKVPQAAITNGSESTCNASPTLPWEALTDFTLNSILNWTQWTTRTSHLDSFIQSVIEQLICPFLKLVSLFWVLTYMPHPQGNCFLTLFMV